MSPVSTTNYKLQNNVQAAQRSFNHFNRLYFCSTADNIIFVAQRTFYHFNHCSTTDYGTLECGARSSLGVSSQPCIFTITKPGGFLVQGFYSYIWRNGKFWRKFSQHWNYLIEGISGFEKCWLSFQTFLLDLQFMPQIGVVETIHFQIWTNILGNLDKSIL